MPAYDITIYGTYTTAIHDIYVDKTDEKIFTIDGKEVERLQKGINIVRKHNGKTRKIVIK